MDSERAQYTLLQIDKEVSLFLISVQRTWVNKKL